MTLRTKKTYVEQEIEYEPSLREVSVQFAKKASLNPEERSDDARFYVSMCERGEDGILIDSSIGDIEIIDIRGTLAYHLAGIVPYFIMPTREQLIAMGVTEEEKLLIADVIGGTVFGQLDDAAILALENQLAPPEPEP